MTYMSHLGERTRTRAGLRPRALLVLVLLAGLLGMHGLGPVVAMAAPVHRTAVHGVPRQATSQTTAPVASAPADCDGCGHTKHADPTCASGAVGVGCALEKPSPTLYDVVDPASPGTARSGGPVAERAPPSLAELQLLRI